MIQVHCNTIFFPMGFNPMIKAYDSNPWQIIRQKAQFPLAISKAQFPLAISKAQFSLAISKVQYSLAISKVQSPLAMSKSPIPTDNIQSPFFISAISSKSLRLLTLGKEKYHGMIIA